MSNGIPGNKENNISKKPAHESLSISTASGGQAAFHTASSHHHARGELSSANNSHHHQALGQLSHATGYAPPQSAQQMNLAKMQLKAREFGKEITNGNVTGASSSSVANAGLFSATSDHPHTVKNSDHTHNHPHTSNIIAVSVNSNGL